MDFKSNPIFCQYIIQNLYTDDPMQFLLDLQKISLKYFVISFVANSIIMS